MDEIFIKVDANKELPTNDREYITNQGPIMYYSWYKEFGYIHEDFPDGEGKFHRITVDYWLKEKELPTEEEIYGVIEEWLIRQSIIDAVYNSLIQNSNYLAKSILKLF